MAKTTVKYIRARRGCTRGIHIHFERPETRHYTNKAIALARNYSELKASQGQWTLLDAVRHKWTGYLPWAGTYTETREQGLLKWWIEKKAKAQAKYRKEGKRVERPRVSKKTTKVLSARTNKLRGSGNTGVKQRTKKVVRKQKRSHKRGKTRTL